MFKRYDIKRTLKILLSVLLMIIFVSACNNYGDEAPSKIAEDQTQALTQGSCWQKEILDPIYDIIGSVAMSMHTELTKSSIAVVMMGFAVWLALKLFKFVGSTIEGSPAQIWNEILRKAFLCLFCGLLASNAGMIAFVMNTLIFPLYSAFLEFGSEILAISHADAAGNVNVKALTFAYFGETMDLSKSNIICTIDEQLVAMQDSFPTPMKDMMGCMICAVADRLAIGRHMALTAMRDGSLLAWVVGFLVWAIFLVVGLGFVFYLVDSIFRMGMMILFLPLLIIAYAFEATRKWTSSGFVNILNSAAFMMAFSIIIATALMSMTSLAAENPTIFNPDKPELHATNLSLAILCLLLIGFLIYGSMEVSAQLTKAIIGGKTTTTFQKNLKATAQMAGKLLLAATGLLFAKAGFFNNTKIGRSIGRYNHFKGRMMSLAGRKPDSMAQKMAKINAEREKEIEKDKQRDQQQG